ncbi:serine/threonine protein kinase [Streptomyces ruber]|uniref:Serine/threonine protein kinase n=2 Tax=Streptomyces TaxID=1883 RepID=A0A918EUZ4_9ACTN|nr:class III lanthionine synthetase LanKC [Streptomyces ruber]GGQ72102.1 serine/threonine protein kinase [Streptomyces ruber]
MDPRYEEFCLADPVFYEALGAARAGEHRYDVHRRVLPRGWRRVGLKGWRSYVPPDADVPSQGWKVHVSATPANAGEVAKTVWEYCVERRLPFKIVTTTQEFVMKNSKYADRSGSGKLATLYPADESGLQRVLEELGELLAGQPGPYILSDLRWGEGPLYVRYGSFLHRPCLDDSGTVRSGIEDPHGKLVPDPRGPVFTTPAWVPIPRFLQPELDRRNRLTVDSFPYEVVRALHFSNGGGVYEGRHRRSGQRLVIKEARPHAGLDAAGQDAVTRLRNERDVLERLRGLRCVPELIDYRLSGENEYLVEEFVDAVPLNRLFAERNPLVGAPAGRRDRFVEYGAWVRRVCDSVEDALRAVHRRGVVYGDLHLFNVLIKEDGAGLRAVLVDFEVSRPVREKRRPTLEHPGFGAPPDREGFAADEYSLAALRIGLHVPLTTLVRLDRGKAHHLATLITEAFGTEPGSLDDAVRQLTTPLRAGGAPRRKSAGPRVDMASSRWSEVRDALATVILADASPDRQDRLFPGDVGQFDGEGGGLSMAYGAAGVLWALRAVGADRYRRGELWLVRRARAMAERLPNGFYNGRHGIAYALWELGYHDEAVALLATARVDSDTLDSSLFSGLSGIGLTCLAFAGWTGEDAYRKQAEHLADAVRSRVPTAGEGPQISGGAGRPVAGLLRGSSGAALFLTAMYEATGRLPLLDAARTALERDLSACVPDEAGALRVDEGWRTVPYLGKGSVGVGLALHRYLGNAPDESLHDRLRAVDLAADSDFYVFSGLFDGRAGMVLFNSVRQGGTRPLDHDSVARQVRGLRWHALDRAGGLAFPGNQLLRLSTDLATGSAGVLLALAAAHGVPHDGAQLGLPFLR